VNFEGIRQGLDRKELEIVFDVDKKITMLSGANGSGKSTILSQLQPYKESFDDRKNLITDGEDGRKEIDIYHGDNFYEIVHIYASTSQSFIKKNGVELNENGGVKTCEEIISKELGITKNYFNIGKIGSNTKNFIEFTTTERKNYIGTFLNIDEITAATKVVQEKALAIKKTISNLVLELKEMPEKDQLVAKLNSLNDSEKKISEEISELYTAIGEISGKISVLENENKDINLPELISKKSSIASQLSVLQKDVDEFLSRYTEPENIHEDIDGIEALCTSIRDAVSKLESDIEHLKLNLEEYKNGQKKATLARSACKSLDELAAFEAEVNKKKAEMETAKADAESEPLYSHIANLFKNGVSTVEVTSKNRDLNDFLQFIQKEFSKFKDNTIFKRQTNYYTFLTESTILAVLKNMIESNSEVISSKESMLESLRAMREIQRSYAEKIKGLSLRPSECQINSCPFIKEAYEHKDAPEKLAEIESNIETVKIDIQHLNTQKSDIEYLVTLEKDFKFRFKKLEGNELVNIFCEIYGIPSISELITTETSEATLSKNLTEFYNNICNLISKLTVYANKKQNYLVISRDYNEIKSSSDGALIEKYNNEILEFSKKIDSTQKEIAKLESELSEKKETLKKEIEKLNTYKKYENAKLYMGKYESELLTVTETISKAEGINSDLKELNNKSFELNKILTTKTSEKKTISENIIAVSNAIHAYDNIKGKLDKLQNEFTPIETVQTALSTSKGIPLILMQLYLERTELIANELLALAYDGDFEISFKTSVKDFFIQVRSKENIKNDIKLASQGETSLTAISLSLALIEQSIGEYNILCLDEIDGPLDKKNREKFINILETQIEKLGIEQVFIISHNDAFDACEMNLILLNGSTVDIHNSTFMANKKILFNV
jgi:DNA repair exonuclease SbcCD ATPase subunit